MKKAFIVFVSLVALLAIASQSYAAAALLGVGENDTSSIPTSDVFTRTLTIGSEGQDVEALDYILNQQLGVNLNTSGVFDAQTAADVVQFQNMYPVQILIPDGLTEGTGVVGSTTITKLNQLAAQYNIQLSNFPPVTVTASTSGGAGSGGPFNETLSLGSTGTEVLLLKNILNDDPNTALTPPENPLTDVFDQETVAAVIKFQEEYAAEILTPAGLTVGTGVVGPATEAELNLLVSNLTASTTGSTSSSASQNTTSQSLGSSGLPVTETIPTDETSSCTANVWTCSWSSCTDGISVCTPIETLVCPGADNGINSPLTETCNATSSGSSDDNDSGGGSGGGGNSPGPSLQQDVNQVGTDLWAISNPINQLDPMNTWTNTKNLFNDSNTLLGALSTSIENTTNSGIQQLGTNISQGAKQLGNNIKALFHL